MTKTRLVTVFLILAAFPASGQEVPENILRLHRDAIVCDLHADTQFMITYMGYDMSKRHRAVDWGPAGVAPLFSDIDLPRAKEGGVDLFNMSICPAPKSNRTPGAESFTRRSLKAIEKMLAKNTDSVALARSPKDAREIIASGRIAVLVGLEGGQGINNRIENLREFYDRGVRYMTITHSKTLDWAESAGDKGSPDFSGLNEFGKQVVEEMEKPGMIIDLPRVSEETFWAAFETVNCPVIVTHAEAKGLADHPRNLTDEQVRAVASRKGVIGVIYYCKYLDPSGKKTCDVGLVADHIDYLKKIADIDVVALGSDWDGNVIVPRELGDASRLPGLTAELARRGYTEQEIRKILGENFLRAWEKIQAASARGESAGR